MPAPPPPPQAAVKHLLPEIKPQDASKLCVVIDLDETLVHSSFKVGDTPTPPRLLCPPPPQRCPAPGHPCAAPGTALLGGWGVPGRGQQGVCSGQGGLSVWAGGARPALTLLCPPQPVNNADFIIPVEIDGIMHQVTGGGEGGVQRVGGHSPLCPLPRDRSCPSALQ